MFTQKYILVRTSMYCHGLMWYSCTAMYWYVLVHTGTYEYVRFCLILSRGIGFQMTSWSHLNLRLSLAQISHLEGVELEPHFRLMVPSHHFKLGHCASGLRLIWFLAPTMSSRYVTVGVRYRTSVTTKFYVLVRHIAIRHRMCDLHSIDALHRVMYNFIGFDDIVWS